MEVDGSMPAKDEANRRCVAWIMGGESSLPRPRSWLRMELFISFASVEAQDRLDHAPASHVGERLRNGGEGIEPDEPLEGKTTLAPITDQPRQKLPRGGIPAQDAA